MSLQLRSSSKPKHGPVESSVLSCLIIREENILRLNIPIHTLDYPMFAREASTTPEVQKVLVPRVVTQAVNVLKSDQIPVVDL